MQLASLNAVFVVALVACSAKDPASGTPLETEAPPEQPGTGEAKPDYSSLPDSLPDVPRSEISSSSSKADMLAFGIAEFGWSDELLEALEELNRVEVWSHLVEDACIRDWSDDSDFGYAED